MNITAESLSLTMASFQTQALGSLTDSTANTNSSFADIFSQLQAESTNSSSAQNQSAIDSIGNVSSAGLDSALSALESGSTLMSKISSLDATYKTQYSELSQMESNLSQLQTAAQQLGTLTGSAGNDNIKTQLQDFAQQYNTWVQRFNPDVQQGGVLANTQAANVSLYELKQSVTNPFIGAMDGFSGLASMGITIDANSGQMSVDTAQLDSALASNKQGVVNALGDFSANFAKSANLLASSGNFVQDQLDNLGSAIAYIDGNASALQNEFAGGSTANPAGSLAQAMAAYKNTSGI